MSPDDTSLFLAAVLWLLVGWLVGRWSARWDQRAVATASDDPHGYSFIGGPLDGQRSSEYVWRCCRDVHVPGEGGGHYPRANRERLYRWVPSPLRIPLPPQPHGDDALSFCPSCHEPCEGAYCANCGRVP